MLLAYFSFAPSDLHVKMCKPNEHSHVSSVPGTLRSASAGYDACRPQARKRDRCFCVFERGSWGSEDLGGSGRPRRQAEGRSVAMSLQGHCPREEVITWAFESQQEHVVLVTM